MVFLRIFYTIQYNLTGRQCLLKHNSTVFRHAHAKRAPSRTDSDSAKEYTMRNNEQSRMCNVKNLVVLLVVCCDNVLRCKKQYCWHKVLLHSWRHLNSHYMWQQGAVCWWWCLWGLRWSRWCASDEYQVSGRQFWLKQMCWYGWQNPTGFQWYQKLPSNPLSVCLNNPCVHVLFYFYRTRVRSLGMLVTNSLTHSLTD